MPVILVDDLIRHTTASTGTGPFVLSAAISVDSFQYRSFGQFPNGTLTLCTRKAGDGSFEEGIVSVNTSAGITTLTWVTRGKTSNSGAPVSWAGTQDVTCNLPASEAVIRSNYGAEFSGSGDLFCANVGAATDGIRGLSGGTDGRIVRYTSSATVANAQNTDTADQLAALLFKSGGKYYRPGDLVPGLSGLTAGQTYWLGDNSTPLLTSPPTSGQVVRLGKAITTTKLLFEPAWSLGNVFNLTGGSNSKIVRYASAGTVIEADKTDTPDVLYPLFARGSDGNLYGKGQIVPFAGVVAGTIYYLGSSGDLGTVAIDPGTFPVSSQDRLGRGMNTGLLYFDPQPAIGLAGGSPVALLLEAGNLKVA